MSAVQPQFSEVLRDGQTSFEMSGQWTAISLEPVIESMKSLKLEKRPEASINIDASKVLALDSAGAWVILELVTRLEQEGRKATLTNLPERFTKLMSAVTQNIEGHELLIAKKSFPSAAGLALKLQTGVATLGAHVSSTLNNGLAMLSFCGETALTMGASLRHPARFRLRPVLFNIRTSGLDALPIVGLLSLLLGVVVAYQSADQLRNYGASIFVADIVGLSMVREFSPLIVAIIVAGRSGSAYTAQIGTMAVTEELDALNTLGISSFELLVIPKILALVLTMPLLTIFSDILGVLGGMLMASQQLGIGFFEFSDRLVKAVSVSALFTGLGKAPVFAIVITLVSCFQGFRTKGGADSVGRQTTRSVVQSIFWVIVVDAVFSVAFNALDL